MPPDTIVLTAHGSRDPRAAATVRQIAASIAAARPQHSVCTAFLDFDAPGLGDVLLAAAKEGRRCVVAPLLLTPAYHARIDIPAIVDVARSRGAEVEIAKALGGDARGAQALAAAMLDRLPRAAGLDGVVVGAAGSRDPRAVAIVDEVAVQMERRLGVPCHAGHVTGAGRTINRAVAGLRALGARNIGLAMYFVAPGVLAERAVSQAVDLGVGAIGSPIGPADPLVDLINERVDAVALAATRS